MHRHMHTRHTPRYWPQTVLGLFLVFLLSNTGVAQEPGGVAGQIVDATTQKSVKDAVVIVQSQALHGEKTAVTDNAGNFAITLLPAGDYTVTVQREGYQPFSEPGLKISVDKTIRVKLQLVPDSFKGKKSPAGH